MAIEWLAGNRLRGTTAERPALGLPSGSVGGWVELGRTTFGGGAKTYEVASLANKRYLMVLVNNFQSAQVEGCLLYTSPSPRDMRRSRMPSSA